ncbi:uncharacterized protein LOC120669634 [Panicum virgatum]|uniref:uncharacterized protein LOC120669634 n=1 Tax=Panicum virgatum TaxID=38727 RepID=UPI0019D6410A|nr:uncharacterized protein LOC120669634 [Panicum virgatum]
MPPSSTAATQPSLEPTREWSTYAALSTMPDSGLAMRSSSGRTAPASTARPAAECVERGGGVLPPVRAAGLEEQAQVGAGGRQCSRGLLVVLSRTGGWRGRGLTGVGPEAPRDGGELAASSRMDERAAVGGAVAASSRANGRPWATRSRADGGAVAGGAVAYARGAVADARELRAKAGAVADARGGWPPAPWGGAVASERAHAGPQVKGGGGRSYERIRPPRSPSGGAN